MQKANQPVPGRTFDERGVGVNGNASVAQRKTGFRADGTFAANRNSQDPDVLVRRNTDPRTT